MVWAKQVLIKCHILVGLQNLFCKWEWVFSSFHIHHFRFMFLFTSVLKSYWIPSLITENWDTQKKNSVNLLRAHEEWLMMYQNWCFPFILKFLFHNFWMPNLITYLESCVFFYKLWIIESPFFEPFEPFFRSFTIKSNEGKKKNWVPLISDMW